jgi:Zn-finger nucleic acid-binding protein
METMNCPVDGTELRISERQGVEIDHCPKCRGVWLDRGELDKILDRMGGSSTRYEREGPDREERRSSRYDDPYDDRDEDDRYDDRRGGDRRRRRRSLLDDLFDFDLG